MTINFSDPIDFTGTDIEMRVTDGEVQILVAGNDITELVSSVSWYWRRGSQPRLSFDISGLSKLDLHSSITTARFRRNT